MASSLTIAMSHTLDEDNPIRYVATGLEFNGDVIDLYQHFEIYPNCQNQQKNQYQICVIVADFMILS